MSEELEKEVDRWKKRFERERKARLEAEAIAERSTRDQHRSAERLERSNKELEVFAYVASHDLQEPARTVSGCVDLLRRRCGDTLDEGGLELMKHIIEGAARMRTLINDVLAYSGVNTKGSA